MQWLYIEEWWYMYQIAAGLLGLPLMLLAGLFQHIQSLLWVPDTPNHIPPPSPCYPLQLRGHLGNLRLRLYQYICATLDHYHAQAASSAATAALASTPVGASSTPGRWAAVRQRFVELLTRGGGGGSGREAVYGSKDELAGELMDLQDDLLQQVGVPGVGGRARAVDCVLCCPCTMWGPREWSMCCVEWRLR